MAAPDAHSRVCHVLETRRLVLRPLAHRDVAGLHRVCNDPAVGRHLFDGEPVSLEAAEGMIRRSEKDFAEGGVGLFGLREREAGRLIGLCGFFTVEDAGEPELAYALLPSRWGLGLATEAARAVVVHALGAASFRRVLVATDEANAASARVIEKMGARPLGKAAPAFPGVDYFEIGPEEDQRWPP